MFRQPECADAFPMEVQHAIADPVEHAFHLMIAAFVKGQPRVMRPDDLQLRGQGGDVLGVEVEAIGEGFDGIWGDGLGRLYEIDFGHFLVRSHQALGPIAIVCQKDQPGGAPIKPSCDMQSVFVCVIDQIDDGAMLIILGRAEDAHRLVHHQINGSFGFLNSQAVERDPLEAACFVVPVRGDDPIDTHSAGSYGEMRCFAPHRVMSGHQAVEFHFFGIWRRSLLKNKTLLNSEIGYLGK
jgi:hypothetical protein